MTRSNEIAMKVAPHHVDWDVMLAAARHADENMIYAQFWNFDHFYPIRGDTSGPCLEAWVTLSAIAQATERVRIGCMVNGVHYRHPAVVANMASALDIVSGGRFELGLGAGWNEEESGAYGIELGTLKQRFDRFDEALVAIRGLLADTTTSFEGDYFTLSEARNEPKGPQQPMPICIGGTGEKRTLRAVARHASHWNVPFFDADEFAHKREVLAGHCSDAGTDLNAITISTHVLVADDTDPASLPHAIAEQAEAGIDQSIIYFQPPISMAVIESVTAALSG